MFDNRNIVDFLRIDPKDTSQQVKEKIEKLFERVKELELRVLGPLNEQDKEELNKNIRISELKTDEELTQFLFLNPYIFKMYNELNEKFRLLTETTTLSEIDILERLEKIEDKVCITRLQDNIIKKPRIAIFSSINSYQLEKEINAFIKARKMNSEDLIDIKYVLEGNIVSALIIYLTNVEDF